MSQNSYSNEFLNYVNGKSREERMAFLLQWKEAGKSLPLSLVADLLLLDIGIKERVALLDIAGDESPDKLEDFLFKNLESWPQELDATALRLWAKETKRKRWADLTPYLSQAHVSQRLKYTLIDIAWEGGGDVYIREFLRSDGIEDLSPAMHGLLWQRALQWSVRDDRLIELAKTKLTKGMEQPLPDDKSYVVAVKYLLRFAPQELRDIADKLPASGAWRDVAHGLLMVAEVSPALQAEASAKILAVKANYAWEKFLGIWPPTWSRQNIKSDVIARALQIAASHKVNHEECWPFFAGLDASEVMQAVATLTGSDREFAQAMLGSLCIKKTGEGSSHFIKPGSKITADQDLELRQPFFARIRGEKDASTGDGNSYWSKLAQMWQKPDEKKLQELATQARQQPQVFRLCYIQTLGHMAGIDAAALKLLDFARTSDEDELRTVIRAFGGINTPRSLQELINCITRDNVTYALQLEICNILKDKDLKSLQRELHGAIDDLKTVQGAGEANWEIRDSLSELLVASGAVAPSSASGASNTESTGPTAAASNGKGAEADQDLDVTLSAKIPRFKELSSEVRRALRTAQFFDNQVGMSSGQVSTAIDLSPVIDMQYKALELTFREFFEHVCAQVINMGIMQRKLDVIGYARPIPSAMDEFENHIASLPIIKEIPFFSKFKLRKMLRAICQFEPGRRFTLDGLKAFGLFFICFGRKKCKYGLQNIFPMPQMTDEELAQFCKLLHMFQDFRNRAAHEGFHPEAAGDIKGIWKHTSDIVGQAWKLKDALKNLGPGAGPQQGNGHHGGGHSRPSHPGPVITRKVS